MNPFIAPDKIVISTTPQDMRAGIQRLASIITCDFDVDPTDGTLYCFVSRDCEKMKLLRFETNGWCMYYVRLAEGGFKWVHKDEDTPTLMMQRRQLIWLLDGLDIGSLNEPAPVTATRIL